MKTLKFTNSLVKPILNRTKTSTWRLFDDKNLTEGDELIFINSDTGEEFGQAIITAILEKPFCDLTEEDWARHEKFNSEEEMFKTFSKYYNREVNKNTLVKIIHFELK